MAVLILLAGLSPWATDMYLSAFPDMQTEWGTSPSAVQMTLTGFLIGMAAGQLLIGTLSDGLGRRGLLLIGSVAFTVCSVLCAIAPTIELLILIRAVQGFAGAAGVVLSRAVISDASHGHSAARRFAILTSIGAMAPVVAPLFGNVVLALGNWRLIFVSLAALGVLMTAGTLTWIPETLPACRRGGISVRANLQRMHQLLTQRTFAGYVIVGSLAQASLMTYVAASSFVLRSTYGVPPALYSVIFSINAVGIVGAAALFGVLAGRFRHQVLLAAGLMWGAFGATALLIFSLMGQPPLWLTCACFFTQTSATGLLMTAIMSLTQADSAGSSGAASALVGGSRLLAGASVIPLTGLVGTDSLVPMAIIMSTLMVASLVTY